ncbi:type IV toxin-antitoxin system AbiEi family antitoxin [Agromyces bauzanensis]|uniref:type IV toxin-antitoxin system AbiEi family antitoxin n=1 Tax=Agromyces bauzanensis TaxID=1308924 RepID=UPI0016649B6C|nr:type IV toxin-antitoxin system AbiEi family antitoxin [Agromyces bauzanensis]
MDVEAKSLVVTARRMSPGAVRLLVQRNLSWADANGHADISVPPGLFISRLKPRPLARQAVTAITWSPSTEAVAEFVLCRSVQPPVGLTDTWNGVDRIAQIAEATHVSQGQVAKVLVALDEEGYTAKVGPERGPTAARELRERGRLLSDWAGHYARSARKERRVDLHLMSRDPRGWTELAARKLGRLPWAVSGWVGADTIAPFATSVPDMILYVPVDGFEQALDRLTDDQEVSPVERGGRIHLRSAAHYVFDFTTKSAGETVASPVRVYADLLRAGGRGVEAAEHLREVAIGF